MVNKASDLDDFDVFTNSHLNYKSQLFVEASLADSPSPRAVPCHRLFFNRFRCVWNRLATCPREDSVETENHFSSQMSLYSQPEHSASFDNILVARRRGGQRYGERPSRIGLPAASGEKRLSRSCTGFSSGLDQCHSEPPPYSYDSGFSCTEDASRLSPADFSGSRYTAPYILGAASRRPLNIWKDLPDTPVRYRLGEGLPWSSGLPEPSADPDDERLRADPQSQAALFASIDEINDYLDIRSFFNPTVIPIQVEDTEAERQRDIDIQRKRKLENLSTALMTVDHHFGTDQGDQTQ